MRAQLLWRELPANLDQVADVPQKYPLNRGANHGGDREQNPNESDVHAEVLSQVAGHGGREVADADDSHPSRSDVNVRSTCMQPSSAPLLLLRGFIHVNVTAYLLSSPIDFSQ